MSSPSNCDCPCPNPEVVEIPGSPGENGAAGAAGTNGINAFTVTTAAFDLPGAPGPVGGAQSVGVASWASVGQVIIITDPNGTDWAHFRVETIPNATSFTLTWLDYDGDAPLGTTLAVGSTVSPSGVASPLSSALPTAFTGNDNTGGTASDTLAAGVGKYTHSVYFRAAAITGNVLLYTYTPGFAFKIHRISASIVDAITTGARAATLTTAIAGVPTTGGVVTLAGAYALGTQQASSAAVTALNTGSSGAAITVTASTVTAFAEGGFLLNIELQNMDTANAVASLADHVNDLILALS